MDDKLGQSKKEMSEQDPDQPFSVENFGSQCNLTLISEKAIKDFYAQEIEATIKQTPFGKIDFLGFLFENGKEVMEKRGMFAKIFHYSNVLELMPEMRNLIKKHVKTLKNKILAEGGQKKVNLKEFSRVLFDDLTACILLGGADHKVIEKFEGMNVTQLIQKMAKLLEASFKNPFNLLPFKTSLGLNKEMNGMKRIKKALVKIIKNEYKRRYNKDSLVEKSILDIMIKLNKSLKRKLESQSSAWKRSPRASRYSN